MYLSYMLYKFNFTALMLSKAIKDLIFVLLKKEKRMLVLVFI